MAEHTYEGGCLCGAVRYRAAAAPLLVEYCHCGMCRRGGGAPVVVWADFAAGDFTFVRGAPTQYESSPGILRGFCGRCGSTLTFQRGAAPPKISVTVGTMDDPQALAPRQHIFAEDALPWLHLDDDLPRHPQEMPPAG